MRILPVLLAVVALAGCASPEKSGTSVLLVKIPVTDVARAAAFYREGLRLKEEFAAPEYGWAQFATGGVPLCLYVPGKGGGVGVPGHSDCVNLVVADAVRFHDEVAARWKGPVGAVMKTGDGGVMFEVRDPDGNTIRVVQHAP